MLKLRVVMDTLIWVLRSELKSSVKAVSPLQSSLSSSSEKTFDEGGYLLMKVGSCKVRGIQQFERLHVCQVLGIDDQANQCQRSILPWVSDTSNRAEVGQAKHSVGLVVNQREGEGL